MKSAHVFIVAVALLIMPCLAATAEEAKDVTLKGEPVDMQCFITGKRGEAHASCARSCAEKGTPIGFLAVDDQGKEQLYLVMGANRKPAKDYMAEHMGKTVSAKGKVTTKNGMKIITVSEVSGA